MTFTSVKSATGEHAQFERIVAEQAQFEAERAFFERAMNEQADAGQAVQPRPTTSRLGSSGTSFPICASCTPPRSA